MSIVKMDSVVRLTLSGVKKTVQLYTAHWLPWRLSSKETTCSAGDSGDLGLIPGSRRSPEEGNVNLLQYSCLENPMDRGAWQATVLCRKELDMTEQLSAHVCAHTHTHSLSNSDLHSCLLTEPRIIQAIGSVPLILQKLRSLFGFRESVLTNLRS